MNGPPGKASRGRFRYRRYGVYDVTYEAAGSPFTLGIHSLLDGLWAIHEKMPAVRRLLADTIKLAPAAFIAYMVTAIWRGIYWAINLHWLSILFDAVCHSRHSRK